MPKLKSYRIQAHVLPGLTRAQAYQAQAYQAQAYQAAKLCTWLRCALPFAFCHGIQTNAGSLIDLTKLLAFCFYN